MEVFVPDLGQELFLWNGMWQYLWTPWNLLASFIDKARQSNSKAGRETNKQCKNHMKRKQQTLPWGFFFFNFFGK